MDERFTQPFWDERYGSADRIWSGNPNPQLVREAADLTPGSALDVGCGEGADAHWLAARGWQVVATDISRVALQRGAAHAEPAWADRISWEQADLIGWTVDDRRYDLVTAHYVHLSSALREPLFAQLAAAVRPGGSLLVVGHHPADMATAAPQPPDPDLYFTAEQVAAGLDPGCWEIVIADARPRQATAPDGRHMHIADAVLRARRRDVT
jgi:SAM-dependent methyltransferase